MKSWAYLGNFGGPESDSSAKMPKQNEADSEKGN